jgi:hypothetical protein
MEKGDLKMAFDSRERSDPVKITAAFAFAVYAEEVQPVGRNTMRHPAHGMRLKTRSRRLRGIAFSLLA